MVDSSLEKYLDSLSFIDNKIIEMRNFLLNMDLNAIKLINILIESNDKLINYNLEHLNILEVNVFEFIKKYNNNLTEEEYKKNIYYLSQIFEDIKNEFIKLYDINIFFYGKDKFGLIENKLLNYNVVRIKDEKELQNLSLNKKQYIDKNVYNILLIEKDVLLENIFFDKILDYSKIVNIFFNICQDIYLGYYDFNYLDNSLNRSYQGDIEAIIVGNSYSLVGIEEQLLDKNCINLSMHSQDLYYSYQLAKKSITKNKNIKQCIIGISYYVLCHDLSKCGSLYSRNMVENVYYPLVKDKHNSRINIVPTQKKILHYQFDSLVKSIFNTNKVEKYFKSKIYLKNTTYYNNINSLNRKQSFKEFDIEYKENLGVYRANQHNKIFKYKETSIEYREIFKEFLNFLDESFVEPIIIVFPTSSYYLKNIKLEYIKQFDDLIKQIKEENIKLIDLREPSFGFDDGDFIDADHLNKKGAIKATNYLNKFI